MEEVKGVQEEVQAKAAEEAMFNPQSLGIESDVSNIDVDLVNVPSD